METLTTPHSLAEFAPGHFEPLVGQKIRFLRPADPNGDREPVEMELLRVTVSSAVPPPGFRKQFTLLFALRGVAPLNDRALHAISQAGFEVCDLLLSRVMAPGLDRHDGTMFYEIVMA